MNGEKNEVKYIEDSIAREEAFAKGKAEIFEHVDALAREHNAQVVVLLKRREDPSAPVLFSAKQARILQAQAELGRALKNLEQEKERNKVVKERLKIFFEKHNFKKIEDLNMEELLSCKKKLEAIRENINQQRAKILASMSLSENKNEKK